MSQRSINTCGKAPQGYRLVASAAYEADHVLSTGPVTLLMLKGYSTTAGYVQLHDSATAPADTAVPLSMQAVAASDNFSLVIPVCGLPPTVNGLYVCFSSTGPTKTIGGEPEHRDRRQSAQQPERAAREQRTPEYAAPQVQDRVVERRVRLVARHDVPQETKAMIRGECAIGLVEPQRRLSDRPAADRDRADDCERRQHQRRKPLP